MESWMDQRNAELFLKAANRYHKYTIRHAYSSTLHELAIGQF
jgi:hypothetical protein